MYGYTNEAGEPIMDGAAYRFEQELDAQYAQERYLDEFDEGYDRNYFDEDLFPDEDDDSEDES